MVGDSRGSTVRLYTTKDNLKQKGGYEMEKAKEEKAKAKAKEEEIKEPEKKIEEIENKAVKSREHICYMDCIDAYGIDQAHKEECFEKCYGKFIKQKKKGK